MLKMIQTFLILFFTASVVLFCISLWEKNKVSEEGYSFDMRSLGHVVSLFHVLCDGREDARYIGRGTTQV